MLAKLSRQTRSNSDTLGRCSLDHLQDLGSWASDLVASFNRDCFNLETTGLAPRLGSTTRSRFLGKSCCTSRNASRMDRFQQFRSTALPHFFDTTKPSRGRSCSERSAYTTIIPSLREQRRRNTRSKSVDFSNRTCLGNSKRVIVVSYSYMSPVIRHQIFSHMILVSLPLNVSPSLGWSGSASSVVPEERGISSSGGNDRRRTLLPKRRTQ